MPDPINNPHAVPQPRPSDAAAGSAIELTDKAIAKLFEKTHFGPPGECPHGRRGLMVECVLKQAAGYADGSTINGICIKAGLIDGRNQPTRRGMRWAFLQIYESRSTIVERLHRQNRELSEPSK